VVDVGAAYAEVQGRWAAHAGSLTGAEQALAVPACPGWSVRDVVAHHTGVMADAATGSFPELGDPMRLLDQWSDADVAAARDATTARQVRERRDRTMADLLEEWAIATARLVPALRGEQPFPGGLPPLLGALLINDVVVHEGDVREALGLEPSAESAALSLALAAYAFGLDARVRDLGLPALVLAYDGKTRRCGDGEPGATVRASRTTLVRMLASRLDAAGIQALEWEGDAAPYVGVVGAYGPVRRS
jgi:uncharacterized protein (TIGR03083 family)